VGLCTSRSDADSCAREMLHALSKRHDICRNLIRVWVQKYEAGAFDEGVQTANLLQQYEARSGALEWLVDNQALELEFLTRALRSVPQPRVPPALLLSREDR
jgi:transposase